MIEIKPGQVWRRVGNWDGLENSLVTVIEFTGENLWKMSDKEKYMRQRFIGSKEYCNKTSNNQVLQLHEASAVAQILSHYLPDN